jgi:hypothetical protein
MVDDMGAQSEGLSNRAGRFVLSSFSIVGFVLALASTPLANRQHHAALSARPAAIASPAPEQPAEPYAVEPAVVDAAALEVPAAAPVPAPAELPPPSLDPAPAEAAPDPILVAPPTPEQVLLAVAPAPAESSGLPLLGQITTAAAPGGSSPLAVVDSVVGPVLAPVLDTPLLDKPVLGLLG